MERHQSSGSSSPIERQLAQLKVLSRLLSHELRAQSGSRLTLSRDEVQEIQTSLDLFIEEVARRRGSSAAPHAGTAEVEVAAVPSRMN